MSAVLGKPKLTDCAHLMGSSRSSRCMHLWVARSFMSHTLGEGPWILPRHECALHASHGARPK